MTGAELLAEVLQGDVSDCCRDALDGCVLLTAEEAGQLWQLIEDYMPDGFRDDDGVWHGPGDSVIGTEKVKALALLGGEKPTLTLGTGCDPGEGNTWTAGHS